MATMIMLDKLYAGPVYMIGFLRDWPVIKEAFRLSGPGMVQLVPELLVFFFWTLLWTGVFGVTACVARAKEHPTDL